MSNSIWAVVKHSTSLQEILTELSPKGDLRFRQTGDWTTLICPHEDHRTQTDTACRITPEGDRLICFLPTCEFNGGDDRGVDVFDIVAALKGFRRADGTSDRWEALKFLARRADIPLRNRDRALDPAERHRLAIEKARQAAVDLYHEQLLDARAGTAGRKYLQERGLALDLIEEYKLGVAPSAGRQFRFLSEALSGDFSDEVLIDAGLAYRTKGGLRDSFLGRLIIPSFVNGKIANIYGRAINPGSDLPHKNLRGQVQGFWNFDGARKFSELIICEGAIDALSFVAMGFKNAVATHGVGGFKKEHIELLKQTNAKRLYFAYDGDEAGRHSMLKHSAELMEAGFEVRILPLKQGKDPNDYLAGGANKKEIEALLAESLHPDQFRVLAALHDLRSQGVADRLDAIRKIKPLLVDLDPLAVEVIADDVAQRLKVDKDKVLNMWRDKELAHLSEMASEQYSWFLLTPSERGYHLLKAAGLRNAVLRPKNIEFLNQITSRPRLVLLVAPGQYSKAEAEQDWAALKEQGFVVRIVTLQWPLQKMLIARGVAALKKSIAQQLKAGVRK